jgi:uncharacterized repeat protein (TIGR01451 family)
MKTPGKSSWQQYAALAVALGLSASLVPATASANTAANATIRNVVTVAFADAGGIAQPDVQAAVDVSVNLVAAAASLSAPTDLSTAPNSTAIYNYTITTNANGVDNYTASVTALLESANLSGSTAVLSQTTFDLGATTLAIGYTTSAGVTTATLSVPADGTTDASINGLEDTDTVLLGSTLCTVTVNTDSALPAQPTDAIPLSLLDVDCGANDVPTLAYGALIAEQQSFTLTVDPNNFVAPGPETIDVTIEATDGTNPSTDDTTTTVEQLLNVTKYVRNDTTGAAGTGTPITVDLQTYYPSGIVANPGQTLEYLVVIENVGSQNATDVVISDAVPAFTSLQTATLATGDNTGSFSSCTVTENNDSCETSSGGATGTIYFSVGSTTAGDDTDGGTGNPNGDGGDIATGEFAYGRFQVLVD